ncbi:MAG: hypothetical protein GQ575_00365 [Deltaproteobacteria bacterium]|nr:hypothetical protein [Deltaproteobacteria bacterium]
MTTMAIHPEQYQKTQFIVNERTLHALQTHPQFERNPYVVAQSQKYCVPPQQHKSISMLYQINVPGYQLRYPLMIEFEPDENGEIIASSSEFHVYGAGDTEQGAADDFVGMLIDLFEELKGSEPLLSSALLRQLRNLKSMLIAL